MAVATRTSAVPPWLDALLRDRGIQVASMVGLLAIWELFSFLVGEFAGTSIMPGPIDVAPRFFRLVASGEFIGPLLETLGRTGLGFLVAFVLGMAIGIASAKVIVVKAATGLTMNILLFAPTLVVIYLGTAMVGVGNITVAAVAGLLVAPNVSIYMRDVLSDFDPDLTAMADSYRVPTRQRVVDVYLPYLVPSMLAASRVAFSQAWKIVMLMEVFGQPGGLGYEIRSSYYIYDLQRMLSFLIVFVVALLVVEQGIRIAEHRLVKWQK